MVLARDGTVDEGRVLEWHHATVIRVRREAQNGHHDAILWFAGLSGVGIDLGARGEGTLGSDGMSGGCA